MDHTLRSLQETQGISMCGYTITHTFCKGPLKRILRKLAMMVL